ncbi:histone-lysine N-methyltransferase TRX1-like isoform X1 [Zingiber officinale]|uniref:histone-lysine N-methyltransferase TRX1-like isoform X1 n=1 Tax=Zingiber officinale TaxID=94328 RepID=UPI001C4B4699|nr:histone-lysine N-methyltransferase TRX1-like isoform X1 [Zingiber officinale]
MVLAAEEFFHEEEVEHPVRYLPLGRVYSSSVPCVSPSGSSSVASKKVKTRMTGESAGGGEEVGWKDKPSDVGPVGMCNGDAAKPLLVYQRRAKRPRIESGSEQSGKGDDKGRLDAAAESLGDVRIVKARTCMKYELLRLGSGSGSLSGMSGLRLRSNEGRKRVNFSEVRKNVHGPQKDSSGWSKVKKWVELEIEGVDPHALIGLECKVLWPIDDDWYKGSITEYNSNTKQHRVKYVDDDVEHLILLNEKIKFHLSCVEMKDLCLKCGVPNLEKKGLNYNELLALALNFHDCQGLEPGELVWAKLTGHAMWPAVVVSESNFGPKKALKPSRTNESILVQFFGTHDFARIKLKQAIPFLNGLLSSLHLKCKQARFCQSLDEAKMYLIEQQLPKSMLHLQKCIEVDDIRAGSGEDEGENSDDDLSASYTISGGEHTKASPIEIGNLCVTSLGRIIYDSDYFHSKKHIWPEGYTAFRKFTSFKDPSLVMLYKMEILRNPKIKTRPLFRVTTEDGEQIDGSTPSACWKEIFNRIKNKQCNGIQVEPEGSDLHKSGSCMFGFSNSQIAQLIQELPNSRLCSKYYENSSDSSMGYRAVRVDWKDLDRCGVCDMDEEYEDNLFLQCDKCRIMVHAKCYGELEPVDEAIWLCNLCRPGAPKSPPKCCLCPVLGGAIKPTTNGRWAHLTCAMWIPETCLVNVKRMEPIDGICRIHKDRWKLLCSICGVAYGACIQCSHNTCRVAYHTLCARAAGLCVELEDEEKVHLMSLDEDDDQCIRLLSFCKKHRQPSKERPPTDNSLSLPSELDASFVPAPNASGCARSEPYNFSGRRGQKQPQVLDTASRKRLYIENQPYLVTGYCQNGNDCGLSSSISSQAQCIMDDSNQSASESEKHASVCSMAEKYRNMKTTFRKRLAFGKSKIHGFGVFAKLLHKAGDMVIEYIGELVRPTIADIRERFIYNSLVGAGTYMFRIDDERVIDATRAGSIAHLINHSCEPNCYSRVISVNGDEHIIIFAKRDINQWEELTYDYRFFSSDERLACYCGFPRCRGIVNDTEAEEQVAKIHVPLSEITQLKGE